jgi:copper chaperone
VRSTYQVTGMTCEHCVRAVTEEIEAIAGVSGVDVDLASGRVTVTADGTAEVSEPQVRDAVVEAGYQLS